MAKGLEKYTGELIIDRILFVTLLCIAVAYLFRGSWVSPFFESAAIVLGVIWSFRALNTGKSVVFRLLATLILVLLWALLSFYLGRINGLL